MIINVTADHISHGKRANACDCPVALAARAAGFKDAQVYASHMYWLGGRKMQDLPNKAMAFIRDFDEGRPVQPFSMEVFDA